MYTITIPGKPKPMSRPRLALNKRKTGEVVPHVYMPKAVKDYKKQVAGEAIGQGVRLIDGSVGIEAVLYIWQSYKKAGGDADNMLKSLMDALIGVAYEDDAAVDYMAAQKVYVKTKADQKAVVRIGRREEFRSLV